MQNLLPASPAHDAAQLWAESPHGRRLTALERAEVGRQLPELFGRHFLQIGYWGGEPTWNQMAAAQRDAVAGRMPTVPRHFDALFAARWHKRLLERLTMPILLMHGSQTRTPARRVTELLSHVLSHALRAEVPGAGHLGPMTHAGLVNAWVLGRIDPTLVSGLDRLALAA